MSNFTVMKGFELVDGKDQEYWLVLAPDGQAVFSAQYEYMARDRASLLNEATVTLRSRVTQLEALSKQLAGDLMQANIRTAELESLLEETSFISRSLTKITLAATAPLVSADTHAGRQAAATLFNKEFAEIEAQRLADGRKIAELERENARMRAILEDIVRNAPQGDTQPQGQAEWGFWVAGKLAKQVLAPEVIISDSEGEQS